MDFLFKKPEGVPAEGLAEVLGSSIGYISVFSERGVTDPLHNGVQIGYEMASEFGRWIN